MLLCAVLSSFFLLYSSQLPDCTENHSSTITVAMATRGEIHFTSLFVTLPPSIHSLSLSLSAIIFFISRCYLLLFSFLPVLVRGRTGSRGCSAFLNKQSTAIWHQAVIIITFLLYFWLNHAVSSVVLTAVWYTVFVTLLYYALVINHVTNLLLFAHLNISQNKMYI